MKRRKVLKLSEPRAKRFMVSDPRIEPTQSRNMSALYEPPASEREPTVYPASVKIKHYAAAWARGAHYTTRINGQMCGGPSGGNTLGVVPMAFHR